MKHEAEQFTLFSDAEVKNKLIDVPWKKSETDKMLDLFLAGQHPNVIAQSLGRNPKAVKRRIEQFRCNEEGRAERYQPFRRQSRKGKRLTENERMIIDAHRQRKISAQATATVLGRGVDEVLPDSIGKASVNSAKEVAPTLDLVLAHRYIFHIYQTPIISDKTYNDLKQEEMEFGGGSAALREDPRDCPSYIKHLALYLVEKWAHKIKKREKE